MAAAADELRIRNARFEGVVDVPTANGPVRTRHLSTKRVDAETDMVTILVGKPGFADLGATARPLSS